MTADIKGPPTPAVYKAGLLICARTMILRDVFLRQHAGKEGAAG